MSKIERLNAKEYWKRHGTDTVVTICDMADTSFGYFAHVAHGRRIPSPALAWRLVGASEKLTPDAPMGFLELLPRPDDI